MASTAFPRAGYPADDIPVRSVSADESRKHINKLISSYGNEFLSFRLVEFWEKVDRVSEINRRLTGADQDSPDYQHLVDEIMEATQDYYSYLFSLPGDLRSFLTQMHDEPANFEEELEEISELINRTIPAELVPILSIQAIRPRSYIMQIDTITNHLTALEGTRKLKVGQLGNQPVKTTVTLDIPEHMKIEGGALSTYDKSIINAVTSLMESGNTAFSVPMLYHAMTGRKNPTVDEGLAEEITGKLEKMRRMMLSIDMTDEVRAKYVTDEHGEPMDIENLTIDGYLLPLIKVSGVINGKKTEVFQLIQPPPLYTYSKMKRQLASVPITLLGAPVNNNATTIPLKTYLLQRIEMMKNQNNNISSKTILYRSIYEELGAPDAGKTKKMRIRNYTTAILQYFSEQGYIKGYTERKKGRAIDRIEILL